MKKIFAFLAIAGLLSFSINTVVALPPEEDDTADIENVAADDSAVVEEVAPPATDIIDEADEVEEKGFHQALKEKFIEGSPGFMAIVLLALILGLALAIERIIYLNLATTNTKNLLAQVEAAIEDGGVDAAKEICKDTAGPVASIFYQGLDRYKEGLDEVEKSIVSYGSVMMGRLEKNVSWISLFIALAPMLGFMGTVIGMIQAFDDIQTQGDISPAIVAGGIKMALLTTVFGLIVAIILQVFYNYIVSKIDSLINDMEDATISFMDILVKHKVS